MNTRRDFLQKLTAPLIALPLILRLEEEDNEEVNDKHYDGPFYV